MFSERFDIASLLKLIMVTHRCNVVIMQNCLISVYYMLHLSRNAWWGRCVDITMHLDEEMVALFSEFVQKNQYDQALCQRFSKIKSMLV